MTNDKVNKGMPFHESPDYLDDLIHKATERAICEGRKQQKQSRKPRFMQIAASLAILMTLSGVGVTYYNTMTPEPQTASQSPLDKFLSKTTDAQAQAINYYEIETINDYE